MKHSFADKSDPKQQGFALPFILVVSTAVLIIGMSLLQNSTSILDSLNDQYYNRLAQESAEAGVAYANYCLSSNAYEQTWGPKNDKPNLTQSTDCNGQSIASAPSDLLRQGAIRTSFSVGNLDVRDDGAIIFNVSGVVDRLTSEGTISRTYKGGRSEVVKWKVYNASISASGTYKTCGIVSNELYCWGRNNIAGGENFRGQLGNGTTTDSLIPVKVIQDEGLLKGKVVENIISEQYHNCALAEGKVYCWGRNQFGQLGNGTTTDSSRPVEVKGALSGKVVTAIGGASDVSCAIAESKIYCWGRNDVGQLGIGTTSSLRSVPTLISTTNIGSSSYTPNKLSTAGSRSKNMCAVINGKAWCWGENVVGQIGNNASSLGSNYSSPTKVYDGGVLAGKTILAISQDGYNSGLATGESYPHVCVVASDNKAYCWGANDRGQLGDNTRTNRKAPVAVTAGSGSALYNKVVQDVAVGLEHSCALASGKVYCWGMNSYGQLGDTTSTDRRVPVAVQPDGLLAGKEVTNIGAGANRACATANRTAYCWGLNTDGQLGDNTQENRYQPVESFFLRPKAPTYIF